MYRILLMRLGLLEALSEEQISLVRECLHRRRVMAGETLFIEGERCEHVWVVQDGSVRLVIGAQSSRRTLEIAGAGQVLPEHGIFLGIPYPFTAEAVEECLILSLHRDDLRRLTDSVPGLGWQLLRLLSRRLEGMQSRVQALSSPDVRGRVGAVMLELVRGTVEPLANAPVRLRIRQTEIAQMAGVARETVSRLLAEWSKAGWVTVGRGQMTILDVARLEAVVNETTRAGDAPA